MHSGPSDSLLYAHLPVSPLHPRPFTLQIDVSVWNTKQNRQ